MLYTGAQGNELALVVNKLKDGVLKSEDNQVKEFGKDGIVNTRNNEGDDKVCEDKQRKERKQLMSFPIKLEDKE